MLNVCYRHTEFTSGLVILSCFQTQMENLYRHECPIILFKPTCWLWVYIIDLTYIIKCVKMRQIKYSQVLHSLSDQFHVNMFVARIFTVFQVGQGSLDRLWANDFIAISKRGSFAVAELPFELMTGFSSCGDLARWRQIRHRLGFAFNT